MVIFHSYVSLPEASLYGRVVSRRYYFPSIPGSKLSDRQQKKRIDFTMRNTRHLQEVERDHLPTRFHREEPWMRRAPVGTR